MSRLLHSCALLLVCTALSCTPPAETATRLTDNPELKQLYEEDQADRSSGGDQIDWTVVSRRDSLRRVRVRELLAANAVHTSEDYRHAAMVFQHGNDTTAARMAFELAEQAVSLDSTNASAKWLMAAAWDRYQMRLGLPQWYGTQFVRQANEPWRLYDMDTTKVTDAERQRLGVRTLAESRARVLEMNNRD